MVRRESLCLLLVVFKYWFFFGDKCFVGLFEIIGLYVDCLCLGFGFNCLFDGYGLFLC